MSETIDVPTSLEDIRCDAPEAPPHVPRDRIIDLSFALGGLANDLVDPYSPSAWLTGPDIPPLLYNRPSSSGLAAAAGLRMAGSWVVTRYQDIERVYSDNEFFSNRQAANFQQLIGESFPSIPISIDPPNHRMYRQFLMPWFSPKRLNQMEDQIRGVVREMMDEFVEKGEVDIAWDFARVYPVRIFMGLMGFPRDMFENFLEWEWNVLHSGDAEKMKWALRNVLDFLRGFVAEKQQNPDEHLTSYIANGTIDGRPLTPDEKIGMVWFLWLGGLDTVAVSIGQMFRRMVLQPELQAKLRSHPELVTTAVEEFLRTQPILSTSRMVIKDFEWHGCELKAGDSVTCFNPAGNFDPSQFADPREVDLARKPNRHFTFTAGIHLCLGAPLARREMRILLEEWFARIPEFRVKPGADTTVYPGLLSIRNLPIVWNTDAA